MSAAGAVYVYYQVPKDNLASVRRAVMALLSEVQASTGVLGRLARRRDDPATWMEIYEGIVDLESFERALQETAQGHELNALLAPSRRHTEIFIAAGPNDTRCA